MKAMIPVTYISPNTGNAYMVQGGVVRVIDPDKGIVQIPLEKMDDFIDEIIFANEKAKNIITSLQVPDGENTITHKEDGNELQINSDAISPGL